jgi:hypothetical protein
VQSCIWELVPHSPELSHIGCGAQGETDVSIHAPDRGSYYDSMLAEVSTTCLAGRCIFIMTKFCMRIYPGARLFRGSLVTATPGAGWGKVAQFETELCKLMSRPQIRRESKHRRDNPRAVEAWHGPVEFTGDGYSNETVTFVLEVHS